MLGWLAHVAGLTNLSGPWYGFWSGFAGDLPLFGGLWLLYRRHTCHARRCWRLGLHHIDGTHFTVCHRHHPEHHGSRPYTAAQITQAHKEAQQ